MIEAAELSSNRGEVAVKTTCGHVIGKSEEGAYVFKVSHSRERKYFIWRKYRHKIPDEIGKIDADYQKYVIDGCNRKV